jgi:hypothetical protein
MAWQAAEKQVSGEVSPQYLVQSYYGAHITWRFTRCFGAFFRSLLGFKRLALALEIDSKRCYYKGSHLARPRSNITKKEKIMKKFLAFVLSGILLCTLATPAFAKRHHKKHHHHHHHHSAQAQR